METNKDIFVVLRWYDVQELMDKEGFDDNSTLIVDGALYDEYGDSSYAVRLTWLNDNL